MISTIENFYDDVLVTQTPLAMYQFDEQFIPLWTHYEIFVDWEHSRQDSCMQLTNGGSNDAEYVAGALNIKINLWERANLDFYKTKSCVNEVTNNVDHLTGTDDFEKTVVSKSQALRSQIITMICSVVHSTICAQYPTISFCQLKKLKTVPKNQCSRIQLNFLS